MTDTFAIRETTSDDSILADLQSRRGASVHYLRRFDTFGDRPRGRRRPLPVIEARHELMDLLVFATVVLLWTSGIVMIIFSVLIMLEEYGLSVMAALDFYAFTMVLQCSSAFSTLLAASVSTSLLTLDHGVARRAIIALTIVIITIVLLSAEITVGLLSKKELNKESIVGKEMVDLPPSFLKAEAEKAGYTCEKWSNEGCEKVYKKHVKNYVNYLIGSSSVALAISVITLPVFIFVYEVTIKEIVEETVRPTDVVISQVNFSETPSLLSVNDEYRTTEEEAKGREERYGREGGNNQKTRALH